MLRRPAAARGLFLGGAILLAVLLYGAWSVVRPHLRSAWASGDPTRVSSAEVAEVRFTCGLDHTGPIVSFREQEEIEAVISFHRQLRPTSPGTSLTANTVAPKADSQKSQTFHIWSRMLFRDGTYRTGRWAIRKEPYFAQYLPSGTATDIDPGAWYHSSSAMNDGQVAALVRELTTLCDSAADTR